MIILDTSFIFALIAKKDKYYKRASVILERLMQESDNVYITTYSVLAETITLAVFRYQGNMTYIKKYYSLFWGPENFFKLSFIGTNEYKKIYQILEKYSTLKRQLSFVDASLIYLYEKLDAKHIISFDGHFDTILNRLF